MRKFICGSLVVLAIFIANNASAQLYKTALGVRLSSAQPVVNNSISIKHFISETGAIEGLLTFGDLAIGGLYAVHKPLGAEGLQWFYGGGGYIGLIKEFDPEKNRDETNTHFGAMGALGLDYKFANLPLNLSLDWKPELNIISDINFEPAALGFTVRFVF